ncbi:MAG: hypothetical protein ACPGXL_05480 [Chitinophagales bacterium]
MVTLREFNLMSKGKQTTYLWEKCKFIMARVEGNYRVDLYGCMDFYAEVWYKYGKNKITKISSFKSVHYLEPYLKYVDVAGFF